MRRHRNKGYDRGNEDYRRCSACGQIFNAETFVGGETHGIRYTATGTFYHPPLGAATAYVEPGYVESGYVEDTTTGATPQQRNWSRTDRVVEGTVPDQDKGHWFCGCGDPFHSKGPSTYGRR